MNKLEDKPNLPTIMLKCQPCHIVGFDSNIQQRYPHNKYYVGFNFMITMKFVASRYGEEVYGKKLFPKFENMLLWCEHNGVAFKELKKLENKVTTE